MPRLSNNRLINSLAPDVVPALTVAPGAAVTVACATFSAHSSSVAGPIAVAGAAPGDVLAIDVRRVRLPREGGRGPAISADGLIEEAGGLNIVARPVIGFLGTAPGEGQVSCLEAGGHGGNMCCRRVRAGARVYLPVATPGGLLALGNLLATLGDGQIGAASLETAGTAEIIINLIKEFPYPTPLVVEGGSVMTIATSTSVEAAAGNATEKLARLLSQALGLHASDALRLIGVAGQVRVCRFSPPSPVVRAEFSHALLAERGVVF